MRAEKLEIEMDNIEKGIVELIARHEIKKLVMGAAADKHYWKYESDKQFFFVFTTIITIIARITIVISVVCFITSFKHCLKQKCTSSSDLIIN